MEFYFISPVAHLELMEKGDRLFGLAHLYVKYPHYRRFLQQKSDDGWFITMDNGAAEASTVTEDILIDIVKDLIPNEVIAPDVLFNKEQTIANLDSFVHRMVESKLINDTEIFFAPQGKDKQAWLECYEYGVLHPAVSTIGMSKFAIPHAFLGKAENDQQIKEARHQAYDHLAANNLLLKPLHFLGAGDMREFDHYKHKMVRSNDSCNAIWSGMNYIEFEQGDFKRVPTPHNYFERTINPQENQIALANMRWIKKK